MSEETESEKEGGEKIDFKLFGKWSFKGIEVRDPGLKAYINLKPVFLPHSGGRHEHKKFGKSNISIVERLINKVMRTGRATGKKIKAINIVKNAFEIIALETGENPIQVLVRAIENAAVREEITRISYGGIVYPQAVDTAPQRRVDLALRFITEGAWKQSRTIKPIEQRLAEEIMLAAANDNRSYAIRRKAEIERMALAAR